MISHTNYNNDPASVGAANRERSSIPSDVDAADEKTDGDQKNAVLRQEYTDANGQHHPIAEFLYQLTKMLTDDNSEIIEWVDGRIKVHYPERLESEVLHKYFRHSKFASFQRQLNYFGFRKIAGKGKMSPCSYVNEAAGTDIRSLLLIKRKTNGSAARKAAMQQRNAANLNQAINPALATMNLQAALQGQQGPVVLNSQALSNAMALLSENAIRASLGQLVQQPMQQNQLAAGAHAIANNPQLNLLMQQQLLQQGQQPQAEDGPTKGQSPQKESETQEEPKPQETSSGQAPPAERAPVPSVQPSLSLEQLHAQLAASLTHAQKNPVAAALGGSAPATAALNASSAALTADSPASAALLQQGSSSMPATAAMDAAVRQTNRDAFFESAVNLKSLLNQNPGAAPAAATAAANHSMASQALLNRLPSANTIFRENSLGNLFGSSNRISSLLSLNSFLGSREPSVADLAAVAAGAPNLPASLSQAFLAQQNAGMQQQLQAKDSKFRPS